MSYAIVYSSRTGNTERLAKAVSEAAGPEECLYYGPPVPELPRAEVLYVGFWTDKGACDAQAAAVLRRLTGRQKVFLFGTAGFGGSEAYFEQIWQRVLGCLPPEAEVIGCYLCQGEMPAAVRRRYEAMPEQTPGRQAMLENFDRALGHPDAEDLRRLEAAVRRARAAQRP